MTLTKISRKLSSILLILAATYSQSVAQTVAGFTEKIYDIVPGNAAGGYPLHFFNYNGKLYFSAEDANQDRELWQSGGTTATTSLVKNIEPGINSSNPQLFKEMNGKVYFVASFNVMNTLWTTNGTGVGTQQVNNIEIFYSPFVYNSTLLFCGNGPNGYELWKTDGTDTGTHELADLVPVGSSYPRSFSKLGSKVIFAAEEKINNPVPWITDGTTAGTYKLADVTVRIGENLSHNFTGRYSSDFYEMNGEAYFCGYDTTHGAALWKTDGTPGGTVIVKTIGSGHVAGFKEYKGKLYFALNTFDQAQEGLWRTDGTTAGTEQMVGNIAVGDGAIYQYAEMGGKFYFVSSNEKLWETDGTISGTHLVANAPIHIARPTLLNGRLYFFGVYYPPPAQYTLFQMDSAGNIVPVSEPLTSLGLFIHVDTMGSSIYFCAASELEPSDVELYRFKDTTYNVGVDQVQAIINSNIYPNPTTGSFSVKNIMGKHTMVYVYSLSGQLLLRSAKTENIDIAQLPTGIYTVQIISDGVVSVGKLRKD